MDNISTTVIFAYDHLMCRISFMQTAKTALKGKIMRTLNENKKTKSQWDFPYMTNHFAQRYFERILLKPVPKNFHKAVYNGIKKDMDTRMLEKEKQTLQLFANASKAVVPIARVNQMVVKKNTLITVY